jgi:NADPH:quinone reductase-like Zn-dependent oxidoreductase
MAAPIESAPSSTAPARAGAAMRAVVQREYGTDPAAVLRVDRVPEPRPGDDGVLVRVHAASLDRGTWHVMAGLPLVARLALGLRRPRTLNPGRAFAGTVEQLGANVTGLRLGDEVYGTAGGAFGELVVARSRRVALRPRSVSLEAAAAATISGPTALQAVRDRAKVTAGQRVLVLGASGGVGSFAVQIAKAHGAEVTGVCSAAKIDFVRGLGADHVIDYATGDLDGRGSFDAILDIGGNRSLSVLRRLLARRGRLVIVGGEGGGPWLGGIDRQFRASLLSPFVGQTLGTFIASENAPDLDILRDLIDSGQVVPAVDRAYSIDEIAEAMQHLVDGRTRGKVVLTIAS